jgi:predicted phage baseplate assembly protein
VLGNLASARHGALQTERLLLSQSALEGDRQAAVLVREARQDAGDSSPGEVIQLRSIRTQGGAVTFRRADEEEWEPVIEAAVGDASAKQGTERWTRVSDLQSSRSFDRHFVAEAEEDGSLWLHFGDGRHGAALEVEPRRDPGQLPTAGAGRALFLAYRAGDPIAGNCAPRTLDRIVRDPAGADGLDALGPALAVENVLPGRGGRQPERIDAARLAIPASLRHGPLRRAVALEDYAEAARGPGVARAAARALGGPFRTVLVLVDPEGKDELEPALRDEVSARIDALRMTGREHLVMKPHYVALDVTLAVCAEPDALPHRVRAAILDALRPGPDAAGRRGYFHPDRLSFGQTIERGDVIAEVQRIPGVRTVKAIVFRRLRDGEPSRARVVLGAAEVARLDADPTRPANGRLEVKVLGIDPDVSERDFDVASSPQARA